MSTNPNAAKSIASRRCAGEVRHIEVRELCIQDRLAKGDASIVKAKGEHHVAEMLTDPVDRNTLDQHVESIWFAREAVDMNYPPHLGVS